VATIVDRRSTTVAPGRAAPGRDQAVILAGALLAATGIGTVLSIITNEALYPAQRHYSTFWHPIFALACFVGGSVAAILSRTLLDRPLRAFAVILGSVALVATVLGQDFFADVGPQAAIGIDGVERWIAYPVLLWMVLFGAALMTVGAAPESAPDGPSARRTRVCRP
jgi:hypothetical protein